MTEPTIYLACQSTAFINCDITNPIDHPKRLKIHLKHVWGRIKTVNKKGDMNH